VILWTRGCRCWNWVDIKASKKSWCC